MFQKHPPTQSSCHICGRDETGSNTDRYILHSILFFWISLSQQDRDSCRILISNIYIRDFEYSDSDTVRILNVRI